MPTLSVHSLEEDPIPLPEISAPDVIQVVAEVADAERLLVEIAEYAAAEVAKAADVLREAVLAAGLRLGNEPEQRAALAARLYWWHPNVAANDIVSAFGYGHSRQLISSVGPVPTGSRCHDCGDALMATSRTHLAEIRGVQSGRRQSWRDPLSCKDCRAAQQRAQWAAEEERWRREQDHDGCFWDDDTGRWIDLRPHAIQR